jgi:long-chain fatty acid transport protein
MKSRSRSAALRPAALAAFTMLGMLAVPRGADAAGLYYSDRGVRPLARGGAFVAGADDLGAIAYNPAGLADAKSSVLLDFAWVNVSTDFTRRTVVQDNAGNESIVTSPTSHGTTPFLPIPTIAGSFNPNGGPFTVAAGIYAPYAALSSFPATVDGQPAGSRYSLVSLDNSVLVIAGAYVAYKPIEQIRLGAGFEALTGSLASSLVLNASVQDRLLSAPESPEYDATASLKTHTIFAPSGHFGVTVVPVKFVRVGLSYRLPFQIDVPADLNVTLPKAVAFDSAKQDGNGVRVSTTLPPVFRAGVEVRPIDVLRIEASYVREQWSVHRSIDIQPTDLRILNVTGFPSPLNVPGIPIPRNFKTSHSFRLGGEYTAINGPIGLDLRAGGSYETSAIPDDYLTPLTADLDRITLAFGVGVRPVPNVRLDAMYAHVFSMQVDVDPHTAAVSAVNPVKGNPTVPAPINGGTYSNAGNIAGLGATFQF